jgi:hypothetical protein
MLLMKTPFEIVILRLRELGAFQFFFPFILTAAIFYGLLRKSKLFGPPEENVVVNGIVALVAAFMVWSYPILTGVSIEKQLSIFMFQSTITMLTVLVGLLIVSFFTPPELPKVLTEKLGRGVIGILAIAILVGIGIFFASGLSAFIFPKEVAKIPAEDLTAVLFLGLLVGSVALIAFLPEKAK